MAGDQIQDRLIAIGRHFDGEMARASIQRCNCMVRYNGGPQMPARRAGKHFYSPEGDEIIKPDSFEMMSHNEIAKLLKEANALYIGHMFKP